MPITASYSRYTVKAGFERYKYKISPTLFLHSYKIRVPDGLKRNIAPQTYCPANMYLFFYNFCISFCAI